MSSLYQSTFQCLSFKWPRGCLCIVCSTRYYHHSTEKNFVITNVFANFQMEYQVSQKKVPNVKSSCHQEYFTDLNDSISSKKLKDQSISVTFLAVLPALEV